MGIDLGLKDLAALSNGQTVEAQQFYRDLEPALAVAQRAGHKDRTKAIHAKISNRRKDFLHKLSTRLVKEHGAIFIGNVNASGLAKTNAAKNILVRGLVALEMEFTTAVEAKADEAAVNKDGQPSQVGYDLPVAGIIAPLGR